MAPPPRAERDLRRAPRRCVECGATGDAVASIARFVVWSQLRTTTSSTCWTPVRRGRKASRVSPYFRDSGSPSGSPPPAVRTWSVSSSTTTSQPMRLARRQRNSQSVSLLCWMKGWVPPPSSISPTLIAGPLADLLDDLGDARVLVGRVAPRAVERVRVVVAAGDDRDAVGAELGLDRGHLPLDERREQLGVGSAEADLDLGAHLERVRVDVLQPGVGHPDQEGVGEHQVVLDAHLLEQRRERRVEGLAGDQHLHAGDPGREAVDGGRAHPSSVGIESTVPRGMLSGSSMPLASAIAAPEGRVAVGRVRDALDAVAVPDDVRAQPGRAPRRRVLRALARRSARPGSARSRPSRAPACRWAGRAGTAPTGCRTPRRRSSWRPSRTRCSAGGRCSCRWRAPCRRPSRRTGSS